MAGVDLTIAEQLDGAQVADALANGGTGSDYGQITNGSFGPRTGTSGNVGRFDWFIYHNATVDQITDVKFHYQSYGTGTGFSYGGPGTRSAAADFTSIKAEGNASDTDFDNSGGGAGGMWTECNILEMITGTNQFDRATRPTEAFILTNTLLIDLASAQVIPAVAMAIDASTGNGGDATEGFIPTAPVAGEIGKDGDTVLGDQAHIAGRSYIRSVFTTGGIFQVEKAIVYTFTS